MIRFTDTSPKPGKKVKDPQDKSGTADGGSVVSVIPAVQLGNFLSCYP